MQLGITAYLTTAMEKDRTKIFFTLLRSNPVDVLSNYNKISFSYSLNEQYFPFQKIFRRENKEFFFFQCVLIFNGKKLKIVVEGGSNKREMDFFSIFFLLLLFHSASPLIFIRSAPFNFF